MSEGPRLPHSKAAAVAAAIFEKWELSGLQPDHSASCVVVGSVRRKRDEVGDIEIVAPLPIGWNARKLTPADDPLFLRINSTMTNPYRDGSMASLFSVPKDDFPAADGVMGTAMRGLKPGFMACSLVLRPWKGIEIPCQIYRYTPDNRGWVLIERTGPRDFGVWFLWRWKMRFGIPVKDENHRASIDNHLVDASGRVVSVSNEQEAFRLAGERYIPPEERDVFMARLRASREALR